MEISPKEDSLFVKLNNNERIYFTESLFAEIELLPKENGKFRYYLVINTPKFEVMINGQGDVKVKHHTWGSTTFDFVNEQIPESNPPQGEKEE